MNKSQTEYRRKRLTADDAAILIKSYSKVGVGQAVAQPPALMQALAKRVENDEITDIRLYYFHAEKDMEESLLKPELMGKIIPYSFFFQPAERKLIAEAQAKGSPNYVQFIPASFGQSVKIFQDSIPLDAFIVRVSPMDEHGYFTFGTNNDYCSTVSRLAETVIVEVNEEMPTVLGQSAIHISEIDAVVEYNTPLPEFSQNSISSAEVEKISHYVTELIPEHACLQFGVGAIPDACALRLEGREDLGIHTEVLTPAMAKLIEKGIVTGKYKNIDKNKAVFTFAMGDRKFYRFLHLNHAIASMPVSYVNDPGVIARNDNVVSINTTIEMDLTGACNSEFVKGHQYTASGGQLDFVRGAYQSKNGKSVIAFASSIKEGAVSKIVPTLSGPVTTPRNDTHWVVTEYGVLNLKGLSTAERIEGLIQLAHPNFRDELTQQAKELYYY